MKDLSDDVKRVQNSTDLERTALLLFAAAAALASLVLIGQAFVRSTQAESDAVPVLSAMGLDPPALRHRAGPAPRARGRHGGRVGGR